MLASKYFGRIGNLLTKRSVAMLFETGVIRTCKEFVRSVIGFWERVDEKVMRRIWLDLDEQLGIPELGTRRRLGFFNDTQVFFSITAYVRLHMPQFAREKGVGGCVEEDKARASCLVLR